jgi:hypothetical protein
VTRPLAIPSRGSAEGLVRFVVDPSAWDGHSAAPRDVYDDLDRLVCPDLRHHYASPLCAHRWLDVCNDPGYGHTALIAGTEAAMPQLLLAMRAERGASLRIALTSLGPGDGALDEPVLRALDREALLESYCGIDSSFELLCRAVRRFTAVNGFRAPFRVTAICADFTGLRPEVLETPQPPCIRLFTLTGLTLGNHRESDLLAPVRGAMGEGDYLLLDARLHTLGPDPDPRALAPKVRAALLGSYDLASQRRFVFGPLELATLATDQDVGFGYELARRVTAVPSALNIVVFCTGLHTTMRFTGEPVRRDRLDLGITTLYHLPDLLTWLSMAGFAPVWHGEADGIALLLLKRG